MSVDTTITVIATTISAAPLGEEPVKTHRLDGQHHVDFEARVSAQDPTLHLLAAFKGVWLS